MFSTQEVLDVTKAAISQLISKGYMTEEDGKIEALNDNVIVDLGEKVIGDGTDTVASDIFFKALLTQLGKIIIDTRAYQAQLPKLFVDPIEWGGFTEFVMTELSDVMIDEMWNPNGFVKWGTMSTDNPPVDLGAAEGARIAAIEFGCYKPVVTSKVFKKSHGIMVPLTLASDQLFTAFKSLAEYTKFIGAQRVSVANTIQAKAEVYALMTVSMGAGVAKYYGNEINLLKEYQFITGSTSVTASNALQNSDFLKYALSRIAETKDNMKRIGANFNDHDHVTFSSEANLILLNKFANATKFNVRANTYHEELLGVGEFDKVAAWQAAISEDNATPYNFETASTIMLSKSASEEIGFSKATTINGLIGILYDRYAMGITLDKKNATSQFSASRNTTNLFSHSLENSIVNPSYPIISFVIKDELPPFVAPTVEAAPSDTDFWGTAASALQTSVTVTGENITGTLHFQNTGAIVTDWGEGYFIGLHIEAVDSSVTKIRVGLDPTAGAGLQTLDPDGLALLKISDKSMQKFVVVQSNDNGQVWRNTYTLSGLTLSLT